MNRAMLRLLAIPADLLEGVVVAIPGRTGRSLRRLYWGRRLASLGRRVAIDEGVRFDHPERIWIGDDTWLDRGAILIAGTPRPGRETRRRGRTGATVDGDLVIGARCHIGPYSVLSGLGGLSIGDEVTISAGGRLYSLSHHYRSFDRPWDRRIGFGSMLPDERQAMVSGPIVVEPNAGIGADCLVLPGVHIARDSFVLPRSVVREDVPAGTIVGGDPAVARGPRYTEEPVGGGPPSATAG